MKTQVIQSFMASLLFDILQHTWLMLSYRHKGDGLPKSNLTLGIFATFVVAILVVVIFVATITNQPPGLRLLAQDVALLGLALAGAKVGQKSFAGGILLTELFIAPAKIFLNQEVFGLNLQIFLVAWQLSALLTLHLRLKKVD